MSEITVKENPDDVYLGEIFTESPKSIYIHDWKQKKDLGFGRGVHHPKQHDDRICDWNIMQCSEKRRKVTTKEKYKLS